MTTIPESLREDDLFFSAVVESSLANPRFLRRDWLAGEVETRLNDPDCRFLLLTAEPGAGKSAFLAQLARDHTAWPRYFIRRDQVAPLGPPGARSFLLHTGLQLAARHPHIFSPRPLEITIRQRLGTVSQDATVVGAEVRRLIGSPFRRAALEIIQEVERAEGRVTGLRVGEWVTDPRLIPPDDLQHLALFDPAATLQREAPDQRIVILIDALDELRYQDPEGNLLAWLANLPPLPDNVRLVLTSRPDDDLLRTLRRKQAARLRELSLDLDNPQVHDHLREDLSSYAWQLVQPPAVAAALGTASQAAAEFVAAAVARAEGNLGYLDALGRGIDQALAHDDQALLLATLRLDDLPPSLENLYAFFLQQVKGQVSDQSVAVEDPRTGALLRALAWPAVYSPILGVLSVAREPLAAEQIQHFGAIRTSWSDFVAALDRLRQFLDEVGGRYRLYQTTLPEFLTRPSTRTTPETRDLYQEPATCHRRILFFYRQLVGGWTDARWGAMDEYGWRHLTAHAERAGPAQPAAALFELCDGGFLEAKHRTVVSAALLEDDWNRVLQACRATGDFLRIVRYGLQRSRQLVDVATLQTTPVARTAARLAVRRRDAAAVERLAAEMALIPHPLARIAAEQALLDALIEGMPAHPAVEALFDTLDTAVAALPPGEDRDRHLAHYGRTLADARQPGWQETCRAHLEQVASLLPRVSLLATLAQGDAAAGNETRGVEDLRQALAECQQFGISDDIVPVILEGVFGAQRVDPTEVLAEALATILQAAPALSQPDCAETVAAVQEELARIDDSTTRLSLEALAVQVLATAPPPVLPHMAELEGDLARENARELLDRYLQTDSDRQPDAGEEPVPDWAADAVAFFESSDYAGATVDLLALLPIVTRVGTADDLDRWHRSVGDCLEKISSPPDLLWVAQVAAGLPSTPPSPPHVGGAGGVAPGMRQALQQIGARAQALSLGEVGFAVAASLAAGYARVGEHEHARRLVGQILDQVSAARLGPCEYPEQARGRTSGMIATWEAACLCGERALVETTLGWLQATAPTALPLPDRAELWVAAVAALDSLGDLDLAQELFERLKLRVAENLEVGGYLATACLQFAEAYAEPPLSPPKLGGQGGIPADARRFVDEGVRVARATLAEEPLVRLLARAAHLTAVLDDPAAGADLLEQALQLIPPIEGDNIKADCLESCLPAVGALAVDQHPARQTAARLLAQATPIAEEIGLEEYVVRALAAIVQLGAEHGLPAPTRALAQHARQFMGADEQHGTSHLRTVMAAVHALHQAAAERDARGLLQQVERTIERLPRAADYERATVCEACAELIGLYRALGMSEPSARWRDLAATLAAQTEEPDFRTAACLSMAHIEAWFHDAPSAGAWLAEAVVAWHRIEERLYAGSHIRDIFDAWAAIPDDEERGAHLPTMRTVLWRIPDLDERDAWQARLALSFWHDSARFRELAAPVSSQGGLDVLLSALHQADAVPEGILPGTLYDLLEKSSRQPRAFFVGNSLLAAQAGIRHRALSAEVAVPVLALLEATIREIAPVSPVV